MACDHTRAARPTNSIFYTTFCVYLWIIIYLKDHKLYSSHTSIVFFPCQPHITKFIVWLPGLFYRSNTVVLVRVVRFELTISTFQVWRFNQTNQHPDIFCHVLQDSFGTGTLEFTHRLYNFFAVRSFPCPYRLSPSKGAAHSVLSLDLVSKKNPRNFRFGGLVP